MGWPEGSAEAPFLVGCTGRSPARGDATGHGMAPCQGKPEAVRGITAHNLRAEIIGEVTPPTRSAKGHGGSAMGECYVNFVRRGNQGGTGNEDAKDVGGIGT